MKIFVAMPTYDGKPDCRVQKCLLDEQYIALKAGVEIQTRFLPGCSHPAMGRNQLAHEFLETDYDKLFFLDSDVTFEPGSLVKLCLQPCNLVGGTYRLKLSEQPEQYPIGWLPDPDKNGLQANAIGLLEVAALPGGFMAISRKVFETMKEKNPERTFEHMGKKFHCFFEMKYEDGKLWGEDTKFCEDWRALGGKVFLDPELTLTHWNYEPTPFTGRIGQWLKARPPEPLRIHEPVLECAPLEHGQGD